jgi:hypothetical protein
VMLSGVRTRITNKFVADDQLQLLLRNALQMLPIVKAQFPGTDFDNLQDISSCTSPGGVDESLACKWKAAARSILEFQESVSDVKPALNSLFEVLSFPSWLMNHELTILVL